jgi:hypothetical protein
MRFRTIRTAAAAALLLASGALVACGDNSQAGGLSVAIASPAKDSKVAVPFTVKVDAGVPLGPTQSGEHHVHLWFDNDADNYAVVESNTVDIKPGLKALSGKTLELSPGEHTIHVSLRNANHSAAGAETETKVDVTGSGPATGPTTPPPATDSGGDGY